MWLPRFASNRSFLDPVSTSDGKPYGPQRYNEIVTECYYISKYTNTSYTDVMDITPTERYVILKHISDELKKRNEQMEEARKKNKQ